MSTHPAQGVQYPPVTRRNEDTRDMDDDQLPSFQEIVQLIKSEGIKFVSLALNVLLFADILRHHGFFGWLCSLAAEFGLK